MDRFHPYRDPGYACHQDKSHHSLQKLADPGGGGQMKNVCTNKKTLPAEKCQHLYPEGGTKLVQLHHQRGKRIVLENFPTSVERDPRIQRAMMNSITVHQSMSIFHHASDY